jgi:hypothetical protein
MTEIKTSAVIDRADVDPTAAKFRTAAMAAGWIVVADARPWARGFGIVHGPTWRGEALRSESVYGSWETCCALEGLHDDADGWHEKPEDLSFAYQPREG